MQAPGGKAAAVAWEPVSTPWSERRRATARPDCIVRSNGYRGAETYQPTEKGHAQKQAPEPEVRRQKTGKRTAADKTQSGRAEASGGVPNVKGAKSVAKTYGSPKSSRSPFSPAMIRRSARNR